VQSAKASALELWYRGNGGSEKKKKKKKLGMDGWTMKKRKYLVARERLLRRQLKRDGQGEYIRRLE
jgi:hypothetical protein